MDENNLMLADKNMENKFLLNRKYLFLLLMTMLCLSCKNSFALNQDEKLWLAVNSQQVLSKNEKWHSFIYSQLRLTNQTHPWKAALIEGGLGYALQKDETVWLGYRWTGVNPNNSFYQENRLFQQIIWQHKFLSKKRLILRERLEEIERTNQRQISLRFRDRVALELHEGLFSGKINPFLYDEIFLQLNKTNYTTNKFISENRLFIGINFYRTEKTWWEIGYINQFQMRTPQDSQNQMGHILSVTYNYL